MADDEAAEVEIQDEPPRESPPAPRVACHPNARKQQGLGFVALTTEQRAARLEKDKEKAAAHAATNAARVSPAKPTRYPVGWISQAEGTLRLRGVSAPADVVKVFKPDTSDFVRGGRKKCAVLPAVFKDGVFMLVEGAKWDENESDAVCMGCFTLLRSPESGQSNLHTHAKKCKSLPAHLKELLSPETTTSLGDLRRNIVSPEDVAMMSFEESLPHHIELQKWLTHKGRPFAIANDTLLRTFIYDVSVSSAVSGLAYAPPSTKFIDANSDLAGLVFDLTANSIAKDLEHGRLFYCEQPFMTGYWDGWTAKNKLPFLGLAGSWIAPWTQPTRCSAMLGVMHMPGSHGGNEIAHKLAQTLKDRFRIEPRKVSLSRRENKGDAWEETTGFGHIMVGSRTDAGGGVPAASRRIGVDNGRCDLHGLDGAQGHAYCLAQKPSTLSPEQQQVKALICKIRKLADKMKDSTQHAEAYMKACEDLIDERVLMRGSMIGDVDKLDENDAAGRDITMFDNNDVDDVDGDNVDGDILGALIGVEVRGYDAECELPHEDLRVMRLVGDCVTRLWATTTMAKIVLQQRQANGKYCFDNDLTGLDLTRPEYEVVACMVGCNSFIVDVQRFLEGERYATLSVARSLVLQLHMYVEGLFPVGLDDNDDPICGIMVPTVMDPGKCDVKKPSDFTGLAETFRDGLSKKLSEYVNLRMPLYEAVSTICDPRIKLSFFEDMSEHASDPEYWRDLGEQAKLHLIQRITDSIKSDRARVLSETAAAAAASPAGATAAAASPAGAEAAAAAASPPGAAADSPAAAATAAASTAGAAAADAPAAPPTPGVRAVKPLLAVNFGLLAAARKRASASRESPAGVGRVIESAAAIARRDVEAYLAMPVVQSALMPDGGGLKMYDPVEAWSDGSCEPSGVARKSFKDGAAFEYSFLAVNALANLGGHAAAGKPERDFSFCGYANSALRSSQKPRTIERSAFNKLNPHFAPATSVVVDAYNAKHPASKKRKAPSVSKHATMA